jgi:hypothetical protein
MARKFWPSLFCVIVIIAGASQAAFAQDTRTIVPSPRDLTVETVDPMTKAPKNAFCIGVNAIDVKVTNNTGYRRYVSVVNRDTSGAERVLYTGWLESGTAYLSTLIRMPLEVTGPAGSEMIRVDASDGGQMLPGRWVAFYVQDCGGGQFPPGGGYGQAFVGAQVYPPAIPQGGKGMITLQTNVSSQGKQTFYFEILNSWNQLWKRLPVSKRPHEPYRITLPVGKTTKPGILTYTVKLILESGFTGQRQEVGRTQFSFRVIVPGSMTEPYAPGYQDYPAYPGMSPYGTSPYDMPYDGNSTMPYILPQGNYPYGSTGYPMGSTGERAID